MGEDKAATLGMLGSIFCVVRFHFFLPPAFLMRTEERG